MTRRPRSRAITSGAAALLAGALTAGAPLAIGALATAASAGAARAQAQAQAQPRAETPGRAADGCGEVVVRAGQTLTGIAEAAGETLEALIAANRGRLADPDRIAVGQRLRLPCATEAAAPAGRDAGPGDDRPESPPADAPADAPRPGPSDAAASGDAASSEGGAGAGGGTAAPPADPSDADPDAPPRLRPERGMAAPAPAAPPGALAPSPEPDRSDAPLPVLELVAGPEASGPAASRAAAAPSPSTGTHDPATLASAGVSDIAFADAAALARAALAEAAPDRALQPRPVAPGREAFDGLAPAGAALLAYPVWWPDCAALSRLPPETAALCARFDASRPLGLLRMAWFARAGALPPDAPPPPGARVCRAQGLPDTDLAALGLAPPRAVRLSPAADADCLGMVERGEADLASLPASGLSEALAAASRGSPGLERRPELERTLALRAVTRTGSAPGRAALAALDAGLEMLARE